MCFLTEYMLESEEQTDAKDPGRTFKNQKHIFIHCMKIFADFIVYT